MSNLGAEILQKQSVWLRFTVRQVDNFKHIFCNPREMLPHFKRDFLSWRDWLSCQKNQKAEAMSRIISALALLLALAACGGGYNSPPRDLDNACSIVTERPKYLRAFQDTERRWGVPIHVQMATIHQESRFIGNARTPQKYTLGVIPMGRVSSAYGYGQALDGTWEDYKKDTGRRRARRDKIEDATDFMGWYMTRSFQRNGIPLTDARNQYLAYHEGHAGYARGTFSRKTWLLNVANKVEARSNAYQVQLSNCRKLR
ncbi:putative lipoprotein [Tritonibacter mobilis]|nr:putative lipoprotein [Tritonibacter mobilis]